jgi:hypothetical protein
MQPPGGSGQQIYIENTNNHTHTTTFQVYALSICITLQHITPGGMLRRLAQTHTQFPVALRARHIVFVCIIYLLTCLSPI